MKKNTILLILLLPLLVNAQMDSLQPGVYGWKPPGKKSGKNILSTLLFEGSTIDMAMLRMSAVQLNEARKKISLIVPKTEERLLLIRSGSLTISLKDSSWSIGPGSIVLLLPGEAYAIRNLTNSPSTFYEMNYRSKLPADDSRGKSSGGSFVKDWNQLTYKPNERGGVRSYFQRPTVMCKRFEMHVTTLKPGIKSHEPHTHRAAEIILMIRNKTEEQIGDQFYKGSDGDIYYLPSNLPHAIKNIGEEDCMYFAFQFE